MWRRVKKKSKVLFIFVLSLVPGRSFVCLVFPLAFFFFFWLAALVCLARKLQEKWALNCGGGRRGPWLAVGVLFTYASVFSIVRRANAQTEQRKGV